MTTAFNLPPNVIAGVISKAVEGSALFQLADLRPVGKERDAIVHTFNSSDAQFHDHATSAGDKTVSDDELQRVDVFMSTLYKMLEFSDADFNDEANLVNMIENQLPLVLQATIDKNAVGGADLVPTSRFPGYTTPAVDVTTDPDSWLDAIGNVSSPNGIILDNSFKNVVRRTLVAGTNINPLTVPVSDGIVIGETVAYFRDLGEPVGIIGDFRQAVFAYLASGIEFDVYHPKTDLAARKANAVTVYAGWRVGYAVADQTAFQPITIGEDVAGDASGE